MTVARQRLLAAFAQVDEDRTGQLSAVQVLEVLKRVGVKARRQDPIPLLEEYGLEDDAYDLAEIEAMVAALSGGKRRRERLLRELSEFDADGRVSVEALRRVLGGDQGVDDEALEEMLTQADVDGDGTVDYDEFLHKVLG